MANDGSKYPRAGGTAEFRQTTRWAINNRDHMMCQNCFRDMVGCEPNEITLDHLITACEYHKMSAAEKEAFGSLNKPENVITLCRSCNLERNKKPFEEFYSADAQIRILIQIMIPLNRKLALAYMKGKVGDPDLDGSIA